MNRNVVKSIKDIDTTVTKVYERIRDLKEKFNIMDKKISKNLYAKEKF